MIHIGHPINIDEEKFIEELNELKDYVEGEPDEYQAAYQKHSPNIHTKKLRCIIT